MIQTELQMLAASFVFGVGIIISYGVSDLLRQFFLLGKTAKVVTELIYWAAAAVVAFLIQFRLNDGILRLYSVAGSVAGLLLSHWLTWTAFGYLNGKVRKNAIKRRIRSRKRKIEMQNRLKKHWKRVRIKLDSWNKQHEDEEKES